MEEFGSAALGQERQANPLTGLLPCNSDGSTALRARARPDRIAELETFASTARPSAARRPQRAVAGAMASTPPPQEAKPQEVVLEEEDEFEDFEEEGEP